MKNINTFMSDSNVVELSSTEMNEIAGGGLFKWIVSAVEWVYDMIINPTVN
jgi:hypothetical protein